MARNKTKHFRHALPIIITACLVLLLSACSPTSNGTATAPSTGTSAPTTNQAPATTLPVKGGQPPAAAQQTVAMPPTQTSCPNTPSQTRPAVMRPLALGGHQNLVYTYNEVLPNTSTSTGYLKRDDATTGQKTLIASSGLFIQDAQVSADGQWILFVSRLDPRGDSQHSAALQLVRMDGQGLQTLYCFPNEHFTSSQTGSNQVTKSQTGSDQLSLSIQWSVNQRWVTITEDINGNTSHISLLDITSGALKLVLSHGSDDLYGYDVMTWLDSSHIYVLKSGRQGPLPPVTLYTMNVLATPNPTNPALQMVLSHSVRFSYLSMDSSYDGKSLFVSYCLQAANPFETTISVGGATGGPQQTIYHQAPSICAQSLRAVTPSKLLIIVQDTSKHDQIWTMGNDGSGRQVLATLQAADGYYSNLVTQFPWSNVSRDSSLYALNSFNPNTNTYALYIGSLTGGTPSQIAHTTTRNLAIVGWTTM